MGFTSEKQGKKRDYGRHNKADIIKNTKYFASKTQDEIRQFIKSDNGREQIEVWFARELQELLGYARWENFVVAISRAVESCKTQGFNVDDHFREVTKTVTLGSGAQREIQDYMLTRTLQQSIVQILTPIFEAEFQENSYGFRPGRSRGQAIFKLIEYLNAGYAWIVDIDMEKFFDNVPQDKLMSWQSNP